MLPPETTRTGFPQVWPSIQKKVWRAIAALADREIDNDNRTGGGHQGLPPHFQSGCGLQSDIGKDRTVLQRRGHDRLDLGALLSIQGKTRRPRQLRATAHD